jgi:hypothetical protein
MAYELSRIVKHLQGPGPTLPLLGEFDNFANDHLNSI